MKTLEIDPFKINSKFNFKAFLYFVIRMDINVCKSKSIDLNIYIYFICFLCTTEK